MKKAVKDVTGILSIPQKYRVWVGRVQKALADVKIISVSMIVLVMKCPVCDR